jgi:hypothetical protein
VAWRPDPARLRAASRAAEAHARLDVRAVGTRHSRGRDRGWSGLLDLGEPDPWARRLWRLGLATHLGGRVTAGMGLVAPER